MLTSTSVVHVSPVAPLQTTPAPLVPEVAPVSTSPKVVEKITPPMEFWAWLEKLKTYAQAARAGDGTVAQPDTPTEAAPVQVAPKTAPAVPDAARPFGQAAGNDAAAADAPDDDRQAKAEG